MVCLKQQQKTKYSMKQVDDVFETTQNINH